MVVDPAITINGIVYGFNSNGTASNGWKLINKGNYYFNQAWQIVTGVKFYFEEGIAVSGWKTIDGNRYYFWNKDDNSPQIGPTSALAINSIATINGMLCSFYSDGLAYEGWKINDDKNYYFIEGVAIICYETSNTPTFYFDKDSIMSVVSKLIDATRSDFWQMQKPIILKINNYH